MKGFLVGLGTGAALGLLFAPRSGDETREQLRTKANDLMDTANEHADKVMAVATKIQEQVAKLATTEATDGGTVMGHGIIAWIIIGILAGL